MLKISRMYTILVICATALALFVGTVGCSSAPEEAAKPTNSRKSSKQTLGAAPFSKGRVAAPND